MRGDAIGAAPPGLHPLGAQGLGNLATPDAVLHDAVGREWALNAVIVEPPAR